MTALLSVEGVSLAFSGVQALRDVSLNVAAGEITAVIGPNGAGKTSLFNCICGVYRPQVGAITFAEAPVLGRAPHEMAAAGVARMFQNLALFEHLTTLENLMLGRHHRFQSTWLDDLLSTPRARREEIAARQRAEEVIDFLDLERVRKHPVGMLPYGFLKRIELGRALCMEPKLLLLDEPAAGLNHEETEDMARYILDIKEELGITQILIEHELPFVLDLADRVAVLDFGQKIADDVPEAIRVHPRVLEAYIGGAA